MTNDLREEQAEHLPAVLNRLLAFGTACTSGMRNEVRFAKFFEPDTGDGFWRIADALLESFALATFKPCTLDIDMESVFRIASERLEDDNDHL